MIARVLVAERFGATLTLFRAPSVPPACSSCTTAIHPAPIQIMVLAARNPADFAHSGRHVGWPTTCIPSGMKLVLRLLSAGVLAAATLSAAACNSKTDGNAASSDSDLTGTMGVGTYVVDAPPLGVTYVSRLTFSAGQHFEADVVASSGETSLLAGSYVVLAAHANDPQSPVPSDKRTLVLSGDSGAAPLSFEFDKLAGGALELYAAGRQVSFTMTKDASWQPAATNSKVIACTGNAVDTKLTLDRAQNRRGTLEITRKPSAGRDDPPTVTVAMTQDGDPEVPGYVYFEGHRGEQDYYANMKQNDLERGSGSLQVNLRWAQGGEEWSIGATCAFAP